MKSLYTFLFVLFINLTLFSQSNLYLHFDGVDDFVEVENGVALLDGATQITMAGWFYSDALIYGSTFFSIRDGGEGDQMYVLQLSNGKLECRIIINGTLYQVATANNVIVAQTWQHVAWVYDGSTVELFIDGVSTGQASASGVFHGTTKPLTIGKAVSSAGNFVFKGRADEVSVWDVALTQTQIQNSMTNEFVGNESGLIAYWKFDQGTPGDDNTFISHLLSEVGAPATDGELKNFALTGNTSNFDGTLNADFQSINFPIIPNKVITDPPFNLVAYSSSGLPISYTVESGPATLSGNLVTLTGTAGEVVIKASQAGNATYNPATDVFNTFIVFDPALVLPNLELLHPAEGDVFVPTLGPISVVARVSIDHPDTFSVDSFTIDIDSNPVTLTDHGNGRFTGWWMPPAHGTFNAVLSGTTNYGTNHIENIPLNFVSTATNTTAIPATDILLNGDISVVEFEATLPSFMGAYDKVDATLTIDCPTGGCDPWDRVSHVAIQSKEGVWHEIIRYLTPYGVACTHEIDLTDFMSFLQGKVKFRFYLGTQGTGYLYSLQLDYQQGSPAYNYSRVESLWTDTYAFGDYANLQPCENIEVLFNAANVLDAARIKLVSTGHGWGDNNTGNAAEFHRDLHEIRVNNDLIFEQDNWLSCNPNPDGCQPQNGTWYHNRAGWCPGAIAPWFDFDITGFNPSEQMSLNYIFDEDYVDFCHPNHPDCITGTTCPNCNDGFNPHLIVASHLITFADSPIVPNSITLNTEDYNVDFSKDFIFTVFPNPTKGKFLVDTYNQLQNTISIFDFNGRLINEITSTKFQESTLVDISYVESGVYFVKVSNLNGSAVKKIIKE